MMEYWVFNGWARNRISNKEFRMSKLRSCAPEARGGQNNLLRDSSFSIRYYYGIAPKPIKKKYIAQISNFN